MPHLKPAHDSPDPPPRGPGFVLSRAVSMGTYRSRAYHPLRERLVDMLIRTGLIVLMSPLALAAWAVTMYVLLT